MRQDSSDMLLRSGNPIEEQKAGGSGLAGKALWGSRLRFPPGRSAKERGSVRFGLTEALSCCSLPDRGWGFIRRSCAPSASGEDFLPAPYSRVGYFPNPIPQSGSAARIVRRG